MSEVMTTSALGDQIKECWRSYKDIDFPIAGDYYYNEIGKKIFEKGIIEIPLKHLSEELYSRLNKLDVESIRSILHREVKEIFQERFGMNLTVEAKRTGRIKVMLV